MLNLMNDIKLTVKGKPKGQMAESSLALRAITATVQNSIIYLTAPGLVNWRIKLLASSKLLWILNNSFFKDEIVIMTLLILWELALNTKFYQLFLQITSHVSVSSGIYPKDWTSLCN